MIMALNLNVPFEEFLWASFKELRAKLAPNPIGELTWKDHVKTAKAAWDRARDTKKKRAASFVPPTPAEVTAYSIEIGYPLDGVEWCEGYQTKGWKTSGSAKMVDWQAAVRKWKAGGWKTQNVPAANGAMTEKIPEPADWRALLRDDPDFAELTDPNFYPTWERNFGPGAQRRIAARVASLKRHGQ